MSEASPRRAVAWIALTASFLMAGCASGPPPDVEAMAAAALPPDGTMQARLLAKDVRALLPSGLQNAEVSNVAALPNGDRWACLRGIVAGSGEEPRRFSAIVVLSAGSTLVGTQAGCPSCQAAALGWQPFPALDSPETR